MPDRDGAISFCFACNYCVLMYGCVHACLQLSLSFFFGCLFSYSAHRYASMQVMDARARLVLHEIPVPPPDRAGPATARVLLD